MSKSLCFMSILLIAGFFMAAAAPIRAYASWSNDPAVNTPIATAEGNDWHPKIMSDSGGGAIITWEREGSIHAQRVDANGNVLWTVNGVAIYTGGDGALPQIASDGAGGAIITWLRDNTGVYAQRVDTSGTLLWNRDGVTISDAGHPFFYMPVIVSDGAGGAIIAWDDSRTGGHGLYAQKTNSSGAVQWAQNGIAVCSINSSGYFTPGITSDSAGGAIVNWADYRNGSSNVDIYAQRIDASGTVQWGADGVAICAAANDQYPSDIKSDGSGGAIIAWYDLRTPANSYDIYAQKVNASGVAQWTANGVAVSTASYQQTVPVLASDGSGGAFIAWVDSRNSSLYVYAQRLNTNGGPQWTANGIVISTSTFSNPGGFNISGDGSGGAIIGWIDGSNGNGQGFLYAQKMDINGNAKWKAGGVAVSTPAIFSVFDIGLVNDGSGGAIFTWYDQRNFSVTNNDIYAQRVFADGKLVPFSPVVATTALSAITTTSATGGGNVTSDGGNTVTARGACWGTSANPTITDSHTSDGTDTGKFTSSITGLSPATTYHVRAYATNSAATAYGDDLTFSTNSVLSVTLQGDGTGIVHSTAPDINCGGGTCTHNYSFDSIISLTPAAGLHSLFGGWSGDCTGSTIPCAVTMNQSRAVLATFGINPAEGVWNDPGTIYYDSIGAAYQDAVSGVTNIKACRLEITENLNFNQGKSIILSGGYNSSYFNNSGLTTVKGTMTVRSGQVTVGNIAIK